MMVPSTTVILPCAGEGSRLGIAGPKELYEVEAGIPMIRYSLDLLHHRAGPLNDPIRVVVVIRKGKETVAEYVSSVLPQPKFEVQVVYFNPMYKEWPGSIYSAAPFFTEFNVVLLPDSHLVMHAHDPCGNSDGGGDSPVSGLLGQMVCKLEKYAFALGVKHTRHFDEIRRLGAVCTDVKNEVILRFEDKPESANGFNGVWGCMGFRRGIADEVHMFLMESVQHMDNRYAERSFFPAGFVPLVEYFDLGTWDRIKAFRDWRSRVASI